jgi:hypothetical protein
MRTCLVAFVFAIMATALAMAAPRDIDETSPDNKWLFHAHWFGDYNEGYLWQLENIRTKKIYYTQPRPTKDSGLPHRINALWSPDSRYVAINFYYGRVAFDFAVIALLTDTPDDPTGWSRVKESSLIKPEARNRWNGDGVTCSTALSWQPAQIQGSGPATDTLEAGFTLLGGGGLKDEKSGQINKIEPERNQLIQFTGLMAKVIRDIPAIVARLHLCQKPRLALAKLLVRDKVSAS